MFLLNLTLFLAYRLIRKSHKSSRFNVSLKVRIFRHTLYIHFRDFAVLSMKYFDFCEAKLLFKEKIIFINGFILSQMNNSL